MTEKAPPAAIARAAVELGCRSVAMTYNDPTIWAEYAIDTARECRERGVKTVAVTAGYIEPRPCADLFRWMDATNIDLKAIDDDFYRRLTGGRLKPVLDTLRYVAHETDVWLEITNLVIPGENDTDEQIQRLCDWIVEELGPDVPLHFSAFHPDFELLDRPPTPTSTLIRAWEIARAAGLNYVYTGNVHDPAHQYTYCPGCGEVVIKRAEYALGNVFIIADDDTNIGGCAHCGVPIAGRYDSIPGDWGNRRQPVLIAPYIKPEDYHYPSYEENEEPTEQDEEETETEKPMADKQEPTEGRVVTDESSDTKRNNDRNEGNASVSNDQGQRPQLSQAEEQIIFKTAGLRVAAAVRGTPPESVASQLGELADLPLFGAFVSLKRQGQLRACIGNLGHGSRLADVLDGAAVGAATNDHRFPPITAHELGHLDMEVWLLWAPQPVAEKGEARVGAVEIGRHGLQIERAGRRGLLLPGVAVDHGYDARQFLGQVCLKAGLPHDAWLADDSILMTFEGYAIRGQLANVVPLGDNPSGGAGGNPGEMAAAKAGKTLDLSIEAVQQLAHQVVGPDSMQVAALADMTRANIQACMQGASPMFRAARLYDGEVLGVGLVIEFGSPKRRRQMHVNNLAARGSLPLQGTLAQLARSSADTLTKMRITPAEIRTIRVGIAFLTSPLPHGKAGSADLSDFDPRWRALLVLGPDRYGWVYDPRKSPEALLEEAISISTLENAESAEVLSLAVVSTERRFIGVRRPAQPGGDPSQQAAGGTQHVTANVGKAVRSPAVAGMFYPESPEKIEGALDQLFEGIDITAEAPGAGSRQWGAALVPHAGWVYSGRLAAETLAAVDIPPTAIVIAPRHTGQGAPWAVSPAGIYMLPGSQVEVDTDLAAQLVDAVEELHFDAQAHSREHAIEVLLPMIKRISPETKIVPIALGGGSLEDLTRLGEAIAEVIKDRMPRPLIIVSTDMNHFADLETTDRVDRLALDAIETLDPQRVFDTVIGQDISMCGVLPTIVAMTALRKLGMLDRCHEVGHTTSAQASGDTGRVVGYAGVLLG